MSKLELSGEKKLSGAQRDKIQLKKHSVPVSLFFLSYFLEVKREKNSLRTAYAANFLFHCHNCVDFSCQAKTIALDMISKHNYLAYKAFLMSFGFSFFEVMVFGFLRGLGWDLIQHIQTY